jgi:hypothetical protein
MVIDDGGHFFLQYPLKKRSINQQNIKSFRELPCCLHQLITLCSGQAELVLIGIDPTGAIDSANRQTAAEEEAAGGGPPPSSTSVRMMKLEKEKGRVVAHRSDKADAEMAQQRRHSQLLLALWGTLASLAEREEARVLGEKVRVMIDFDDRDD